MCLSGAVSGAVACPSPAAADPLRLVLPGPALPRVAAPQRRAVVDRIVAVVDGDPLLLSELRRRARPFATRLPVGAAPWQRAAWLRRICRELLPQLIEERVIANAAKRAGVGVDDASVATALASWAKQASTTVAAIMDQARAAGTDEADVRDQVRRALLAQQLFWSARSARAAGSADRKAGAKALERERKRWIADLVARASVQVLVTF